MGRKRTNHVHEYVEYDEAMDTSRCLMQDCTTVLKGKHGSNLLRHFAVHHSEVYVEIVEKNGAKPEECSDWKPPGSSQQPRLRQDTFSLLKRFCVNLVKHHGRPLSLFDDYAFREIINLIPFPSSDKKKITSKYIAKHLNDKDVAVDMKTGTTNRGETRIKGEVLQCNCASSSDAEGNEHSQDCALRSSQHLPYWNYFEVSVDVATCTICKDVINWTNLSMLKDHLTAYHPATLFKDDDAEFENGVTAADSNSSVASNDDTNMEEVYLNDDMPVESTPRKKRKASHTNIFTDQRENISGYTQGLSEWAQGLDRFGLYVSALMRFLPRSTCIKFQGQIVQRLLQEQAAAS